MIHHRLATLLLITLLFGGAGCARTCPPPKGCGSSSRPWVVPVGTGVNIVDSMSFEKNVEVLFHLEDHAVISFRFDVRTEKALDVFFSAMVLNSEKTLSVDEKSKRRVTIKNGDIFTLFFKKGSHLMEIKGDVPCNTIVEWRSIMKRFTGDLEELPLRWSPPENGAAWMQSLRSF